MKGSEYDMFDLENQMLEKVDAKNPNNEYYNNTNGGSRYTSLSAAQEARIDDFIHKFKSETICVKFRIFVPSLPQRLPYFFPS